MSSGASKWISSEWSSTRSIQHLLQFSSPHIVSIPSSSHSCSCSCPSRSSDHIEETGRRRATQRVHVHEDALNECMLRRTRSHCRHLEGDDSETRLMGGDISPRRYSSFYCSTCSSGGFGLISGDIQYRVCTITITIRERKSVSFQISRANKSVVIEEKCLKRYTPQFSIYTLHHHSPPRLSQGPFQSARSHRTDRHRRRPPPHSRLRPEVGQFGMYTSHHNHAKPISIAGHKG